MSRGVIAKHQFCSCLSEHIQKAQGYAGLVKLLGADVTSEEEWLDQIANTIAEDYRFPGVLKTIEIAPVRDTASPRTQPKTYKVEVTAEESQYEVLLPDSVTSFHVRAIVNEHAALRLTTRNEQCDLLPN